MNIKSLIQEKCVIALNTAFPENVDTLLLQGVEISQATQEKFGHYQCNSAMKWSKILGLKPREISEIWVKILEENKDLVLLIFI
jgi:arginyl-tRNA synthetase